MVVWFANSPFTTNDSNALQFRTLDNRRLCRRNHKALVDGRGVERFLPQILKREHVQNLRSSRNSLKPIGQIAIVNFVVPTQSRIKASTETYQTLTCYRKAEIYLSNHTFLKPDNKLCVRKSKALSSKTEIETLLAVYDRLCTGGRIFHTLNTESPRYLHEKNQFSPLRC